MGQGRLSARLITGRLAGMGEVVPIIFLAVILKIPVLYGMWLIYWAVKEEPEVEGAGGSEDHSFRRWRRDPSKPRGPRRGGPHGGAAQAQPDCPPAGRKRTPLIEPRLAPGTAAHERREHAPAGS
jgi:hypothetical protein